MVKSRHLCLHGPGNGRDICSIDVKPVEIPAIFQKSSKVLNARCREVKRREHVMLLGLDAAAAGMKARLDQQDVIANNLANVSTPGYRRKAAGFTTFQSILANSQDKQNTATVKMVVSEDKNPGSMIQTGNASDIAVEGPGQLVTQNGAVTRLVRAGNLYLNSNKQLVTKDGSLVLGQNGPVTVTGSDWKIDIDGTVRCGGTKVDTLQIQKDPSADPNASIRIISGSLEGSNVNTVQEMVSMISNLRAYEANEKSIQAIDGTLDKVINQMQK